MDRNKENIDVKGCIKENIKTGKRRSSILKLPRSPRNALQEVCENKGEKEKRGSRRVSFADTFQIKELVFNHDGMTEVNFTQEVRDKCEEDAIGSPEKFPRKRRKSEGPQYFIPFRDGKECQEDSHQYSESTQIIQEVTLNTQLERHFNSSVNFMRSTPNCSVLKNNSCNISETTCVGNGLLDEQDQHIHTVSAYTNYYINETNMPLSNLPTYQRSVGKLPVPKYYEYKLSPLGEDLNVTRYSSDIEETTCIGKGLITEEECNITIDKTLKYCINDIDEMCVSTDNSTKFPNNIKITSIANNYKGLSAIHSDVIMTNTNYIDDAAECAGIIYENDQCGSLENDIDKGFDSSLDERTIADKVNNKKIKTGDTESSFQLYQDDENVNSYNCSLDETTCAGDKFKQDQSSMHTQFITDMEETCAALNNSVTDDTCENEEMKCQTGIIQNKMNKTICYNDDLNLTSCVPAPILLAFDELPEHDLETTQNFHSNKNAYASVVSSDVLDDNMLVVDQEDVNTGNVYEEQNSHQEDIKFTKFHANSSIKSIKAVNLLGHKERSMGYGQDLGTTHNFYYKEKLYLPIISSANVLDNKTSTINHEDDIDNMYKEQNSQNPGNFTKSLENSSIKLADQSTKATILLDHEELSMISGHNWAATQNLHNENFCAATSSTDILDNKIASVDHEDFAHISSDVCKEQNSLLPQDADKFFESHANSLLKSFNQPTKATILLDHEDTSAVSGLDLGKTQNFHCNENFCSSVDSPDILDTEKSTLDHQDNAHIHNNLGNCIYGEQNSINQEVAGKFTGSHENFSMKPANQLTKKLESNSPEKNNIQKIDVYVENDSTSGSCDIRRKILEEKLESNSPEKNNNIKKIDASYVGDDSTSGSYDIKKKIPEEQPKLNIPETDNIQKLDAHLSNDSTLNTCNIRKNILEEMLESNSLEKNNIQKLDTYLGNDSTLDLCDIRKKILEEQPKLNSPEKNDIENLNSQIGSDFASDSCNIREKILEEQPKLDSSEKNNIQKVVVHFGNDSSLHLCDIKKRIVEKSKLNSPENNMQKLDAHLHTDSTSNTCDIKREVLEEKPKLNIPMGKNNQKLETQLDFTLNTCDIRKRILEEIGNGSTCCKHGIFFDSVHKVDRYQKADKLKTGSAISKLYRKLVKLSKTKCYKWRLSIESNSKIGIIYLNGWYEVEISLKKHNERDTNFSISDITLQSHIIGKGCTKELSKYIQINFDRICVRHSSLQNPAQFLEDLSLFLRKLHPLVIDLRHVEVSHPVEFKDTLLTVIFTSRHSYQKIAMTFIVDFETYPNSVVHFKYQHIGDKSFSEETLQEAIRQILPGRNYLWRVVAAVDKILRN